MLSAILSLLFNQQLPQMALAHPALNTTGRRRGKVKFKSAAEAKRARELEEEWQDLQKRWGVTNSPRTKKSAAPLSYSLSVPAERSTKHIPSVNTGHTGAVATKQIPQYTGNKMIGIAVQHKSCLQPIFTEEQAKESATMRRN